MIEKIYFRNGTEGIPLYYLKKRESLYISFQIWVHVGSVNELDFEQGMAHMIEHLFFKRTKTIGRGELEELLYQMSGTSNAYTSKDFTVYLFSVPKMYLLDLISILSSLFESQSFEEEDLTIEKEIVSQEINMYEDDPFSCLIDEAFLFSDMNYNYNHKILGTRESVKSFSLSALKNFFKRYYSPENMILFVSGDISFFRIKKALEGSFFSKKVLVPVKHVNKKYIEKKGEKSNQAKNKRKIIFSDSYTNHFLLTFLFPVCEYKDFFIFKALNLLLGGGKDSLLYKKLCIELCLVTDIRSFFHGMAKETFFFIYFNPIMVENENIIITHIMKVIAEIQRSEYQKTQLERILNILDFEYYSMLTDESDEYISVIGPYAFSEQSHSKSFHFLKKIALSVSSVERKISKLALYFTKKVFSIVGFLSQKDKKLKTPKQPEVRNEVQQNTQVVAKKEFLRIHQLSKKKVVFPIHDIFYDSILIKERFTALFAKEVFNVLLQGDEIIVLYFDFKVKYYYQEKEALGSVAFLFDWMAEGTIKFPGKDFSEAIEKYGIEFIPYTGFIEMRFLKKYIVEALELLQQYILFPEFAESTFNLLKLQTTENINNFLDDLSSVGIQRMRELIYKDHMYGSNPSGTIESINSFSSTEIKKLYQKYIIPTDSRIIIVGNIDRATLVKELKKLFSVWENCNSEEKKEEMKLSRIEKNNRYIYHTTKEQALIIFGALSVKKYTQEYYHLLIADQLFSGGIIGSMNSRLFALRESTGFFYDISGSLILGCSEIEGMILVKALTQKKYLESAEKLISQLIEHFYENITEEEIEYAKRTLMYSLMQKTENKNILLQSIVYQSKYSFTAADIKSQYQWIEKSSKEEIQQTIRKYMNDSNFITLVYKDE